MLLGEHGRLEKFWVGDEGGGPWARARRQGAGSAGWRASGA
ncbi:uncharacterized protein AruCF_0124 [Achromobacter ruhlandii]|nr:uncharacterized protein AruCF_0124 [Achromobacter ruhlandii]